MRLPPLLFLLAIPRNRRPNSPQLSLRTIRYPLAQILQLALGFGLFARRVLLDALPAEILAARQVANGFFGGAKGLVPGSGIALVVLGLFTLILSCCWWL